MAGSTELETANDGDVLLGADMQESIDELLAMADALNPFLETETDVEVARKIGRAQQGLRSLAMSLVGAQIDLLAGQAKITADHINAAVAFADGVISQIAAWRKRIEKIGKLLDFFAVVLTGNGAEIVQAAVNLKTELEAG